MSNKYFGSWSNYEEVEPDWLHWDQRDRNIKLKDFPTNEQILFASYGGGAYAGDAFVIFERDGKLYEVHGSHCSCNGLEGQWEPEETSWDALALRKRDERYGFLYDHDKEAIEIFWKLVDSRKS